jgi:hypothetical protein
MSGSPAFSGLVRVRINPLVGGSLVQRPVLQDRKVLGKRSPDLSLHLGPTVRRHIVLRHEVGRSRRPPSGSSPRERAARRGIVNIWPSRTPHNAASGTPGRLRAGGLLSFCVSAWYACSGYSRRRSCALGFSTCRAPVTTCMKRRRSLGRRSSSAACGRVYSCLCVE